jgi:hypothetical protein
VKSQHNPYHCGEWTTIDTRLGVPQSLYLEMVLAGHQPDGVACRILGKTCILLSPANSFNNFNNNAICGHWSQSSTKPNAASESECWDYLQLQSTDDSSNITASEKINASGAPDAGETIQEVVQFLDENQGAKVGFHSVLDNVTLRDDTPVNADLGDFLSRPVRIGTFTWSESDTVGTMRTYNPWSLFFSDPRIAYKLNNYSFLQCDLKIKVLINASPFYYGAMQMSYLPLYVNNPSTIVQDTGTSYFIPYSQRPHLWIYPQNNEGGEMTLPFLLHYNWLRIQKSIDFTNMGQLTFLNYTTLKSANGVSGAGVTVQIYAWAENVRLAGPSAGLALQAKDEYLSKPSDIASAVAEASGKLRRVPVIGPFATASQMGARALAGGMKALGFTNTPVIDNVAPYRPAGAAPMSTSEISYPVEKLTLDPKNELTIDPIVAGLKGPDEMSIAHLVQHESYLCTGTWSTTNNVDDLLFSSAVSPFMYDNDSATNQKIYMTPMCWLGYNFVHWRGDIIFRFRFVASPYHKGRVRITYDPYGYSAENIYSDVYTSSVCFTQIVDLGKDTDVEIRVPYQQATSWLRSWGFPDGTTKTWSISGSATFATDDRYHNGSITMRVLTGLTAPISTSNVSVLIFVRGADNLEFANPANCFSENTSQYTYLTPQSKDEVDGEERVQSIIAGGTIHFPAPERYLVYFGEAITSMRQVLRRASLAEVRSIAADTTNWAILWQKTMGRWPRAPGYDTNGLDSAKGIITTTNNYKYNYCEFHPITYFQTAFLGTRGSVIWHFNVENTAPVGHLRVMRNPYTNAVPGETKKTLASGSTSSAIASFYQSSVKGGQAGMALTNQTTQAGISILMPNYSNYKFQSTNPLNATKLQSSDGSGYDSCVVQVGLNGTAGPAVANTKVWCYAGAGTDYTCLYFLNVPTMWIYSSFPTAN